MDTRPCARMLAFRTAFAGTPATHTCTKRDLPHLDTPPRRSHTPATPPGQHRILQPPLLHLTRCPDSPTRNRDPCRSCPPPIKKRHKAPHPRYWHGIGNHRHYPEQSTCRLARNRHRHIAQSTLPRQPKRPSQWRFPPHLLSANRSPHILCNTRELPRHPLQPALYPPRYNRHTTTRSPRQ